MSFSETCSSDGLGKQPEISLFSPSLQVDSGITTKDDGDRGIRDSEVDTAKTSDYKENQLIRRKLGLSKKQSHTLQEIFKIHNPFTPSTLRLALAGQLKLDPVTVDDWFRMKRERTKLKQTEAIDAERASEVYGLTKGIRLYRLKWRRREAECRVLKRSCETITEENWRLRKEVAEILKKLSSFMG